MDILSHWQFSSRFIRRFFFLFLACLLLLSIIILNGTTVRNTFYDASLINKINITPYRAPNQALNNQQAIAIIQNLPLIHRPSPQSNVLRALLIFYPTDQESTFQLEFRWLYRSWTEMMKNESSLWRTDFVVFANEYVSFFKDLDCVYDEIRTDAKEKPKCRVFPYVRIKDRASKHKPSSKYQTIDPQRSKLLYEHLHTYSYIDSINTVFEYSLTYSMYDYILRTDMDCFLTNNFAFYVPYNNSMLVGRGGYSTQFNSNRLKRIAKDMKWEYADKNSLGSTWYGPPSIAHRMANFTIQAMLHLAMNEFTTPERQHKLGVMLWPEWHFGVLLLYGGHLAINHLIISENLRIDLADQLLDQGVTSKDKTDIKKNYRLHLHCWHGSEPFSKFDFKAGKYNAIDPQTLISDTSASGYAMRMALESQIMSLEQLKQAASQIIMNKIS